MGKINGEGCGMNTGVEVVSGTDPNTPLTAFTSHHS